MTKVAMFPGQGAQFPGMGTELFGDFLDETAAANDVLGYDLEVLCRTGTIPEAKPGALVINSTQYTQPAIYWINCLSFLKAQRQHAQQFDFFIGHSLGEYSALFAAGALNLIEGLKLVNARARHMTSASQSQSFEAGTMIAVMGLYVEEVMASLEEAKLCQLDLANWNSQQQVVISGPLSQIEKAETLFASMAVRAVRLNVSAAFHSRSMVRAAQEFERDLTAIEPGPSCVKVIANTTAQPYKIELFRHTLADQIYSSVRWYETVESLLQKTDAQFFEFGPGTILTGLLSKIRAA